MPKLNKIKGKVMGSNLTANLEKINTISKKKNVPDTPFQIVGKIAKRAVKDVKSVIKAPGKFVEGIVKRDEKIKNNQQARYEEEGKAANEAQSGFRYGIRKQK